MMNELETHSQSPRGELQRSPRVVRDVDTGMSSCLIVSTCPAKRELLALAASEAGWETIVCQDGASARVTVERVRFQMAWVDLESPTSPSEFRELCRSISALPQVLQVICGHVDDVKEEIWARQLGVWLYLPGVSLEHADELVMLCEQAQLVAGMTQARDASFPVGPST
jgi:DNA-binding NtrC family response regulator